MAKRKVQSRKQHEATKKLQQKEKKVMADQKENVVGNNGERVVTPEEQSYIEDTRKPETTPQEILTKEILENMDDEKALEKVAFDPKAIIAKYLKK